jgi:serine/threonine protein kinase
MTTYHVIANPESNNQPFLFQCNHGSMRFKSIKRLGGGGFGTVYVCENSDSTGYVALKKIENRSSNECALIEEALDIMRKEIQHDNICPVLDAFYYTSTAKNENKLYITMPYYRNGDVRMLIGTKKSISRVTIVYIAIQMLDAMSVKHAKHIVHRDISPENILFGDDPHLALPHVLLSDFDTVRVLDGTRQYTEKVGKTKYFAPEILTKDYNEKVDVWSFGIVLLELMVTHNHELYDQFFGENVPDLHSSINIVNQCSHQVRRHIQKDNIDKEILDVIFEMICFDTIRRVNSHEALQRFKSVRDHIPNADVIFPRKEKYISDIKLIIHDGDTPPHIPDWTVLKENLMSSKGGKCHYLAYKKSHGPHISDLQVVHTKSALKSPPIEFSGWEPTDLSVNHLSDGWKYLCWNYNGTPIEEIRVQVSKEKKPPTYEKWISIPCNLNDKEYYTFSDYIVPMTYVFIYYKLA